MKKKQTILNALVVLLALSPIAYLLIIWPSVPKLILTRFNLNEPVETQQSRQALLIATIVLSVTSAVVYLLMRNLERIDPKVKGGTPTRAFNRMGFSVTVFLVLLNYYFILTAKHSWEVSQTALFLFGGLLLAVLGNYMNNIKPNFFAGIRLPWTLNDENNWRKTHHLAGKLWFFGGILLALISLLLPEPMLKPLFIGSLILLVVIPGVYSYRLFKNKN